MSIFKDNSWVSNSNYILLIFRMIQFSEILIFGEQIQRTLIKKLILLLNLFIFFLTSQRIN